MADLLAINDLKTNKFDTENLMKCIDIQHKQIMMIIILLNECMGSLVIQKNEN